MNQVIDLQNILGHHFPHLSFSVQDCYPHYFYFRSEDLHFFVSVNSGICFDYERNLVFLSSETSYIDNLYSLMIQYNDSIPF